MKNYFKRTKAWNSMMGVATPDKFEFPVIESQQLARDLAVEEAEEMFEANSKQDVLDSLADQQFVLWGNVSRYGISWEEFMDYTNKVVKSNESKFANNEDEAIASVKKEAERLGISEEKIAYLQLDGKYIIYNKDTNKILKSVNYLPPEKM